MPPYYIYEWQPDNKQGARNIQDIYDNIIPLVKISTTSFPNAPPGQDKEFVGKLIIKERYISKIGISDMDGEVLIKHPQNNCWGLADIGFNDIKNKSILQTGSAIFIVITLPDMTQIIVGSDSEVVFAACWLVRLPSMHSPIIVIFLATGILISIFILPLYLMR